jgi:hypothetical protein
VADADAAGEEEEEVVDEVELVDEEPTLDLGWQILTLPTL